MANVEHLLFLGAGASYGSETDKSIVPPLAADLFDALLKFEPNVWGQVPDDIAKEYRRDFEGGVLALAEKLPHALPIAQRSMAAFFYRFGPTANSLYARLAQRIAKSGWKGAIATLNYERMLMMALSRNGVGPVCNVPEVKPGQIEICLPHGCCNLFCEGVRASAGGVSFAGLSVTTQGHVISLNNPDEFWSRIRNDAMPPVMSYFEPAKFTTSCANFIEEQRRRLADLISGAQSIAVVGIQVRERDSHIWEALASTNAIVYYCSGNRGAEAYWDWKARARDVRGKNDTVSEGYWDNDFEAICAHLGLKE
jgi:hypothetical protein